MGTKQLLKGIGRAVLATIIIPTAIEVGTHAARKYAAKLQKKNQGNPQLGRVNSLVQLEAEPS